MEKEKVNELKREINNAITLAISTMIETIKPLLDTPFVVPFSVECPYEILGGQYDDALVVSKVWIEEGYVWITTTDNDGETMDEYLHDWDIYVVKKVCDFIVSNS